MIKEFVDAIVNSIFTPISEYFTSWVEFFTSPLWLWYGIGLGVFLFVCFIAVFLPFKWVRVGLGAILVLGGAFLAGGTQMYRSQKSALKAEQAKRKALERQLSQQQNQQGSGSSGGSWFGWMLLLFVLIPQNAEAQYEFTCVGLRSAVRDHGASAVRRWAIDQGYSSNEIRAATAKCMHRKRNTRVTHTASRANGR